MNESPKIVETAVPNKRVDPEDYNPLIANDHEDTMQRVSCVLRYLQQHELDTDDVVSDEGNYSYGRWLVYGVLIQALQKGKEAGRVQS